jgi:hypothetical protein
VTPNELPHLSRNGRWASRCSSTSPGMWWACIVLRWKLLRSHAAAAPLLISCMKFAVCTCVVCTGTNRKFKPASTAATLFRRLQDHVLPIVRLLFAEGPQI